MAVTHTFVGVDVRVKSNLNARKRCDRYVYSVWRNGTGSLVSIEMPCVPNNQPVIPDLIDLSENAAEWRTKLLAANPGRLRG